MTSTDVPQIYLDHQATTAVDERVVEAMLPYFNNKFGNAASRNHQFGWDAEQATQNARETMATGINAKSREIVFTSGATESNNLAILGVAKMYAQKGKHLITCSTEHKAVLDPMAALENAGYEVTVLSVDTKGNIDLNELRNAIREDTILVSLMMANNEIGTIHPMKAIGDICHENGVLFHTDATQALGKELIDVQEMNIDLLSGSAHKMYGPKGVGFLYVRRRNPRVRIEPVFYGGGHERGMRSGTLNVPGIVGMAKAFEICLTDRDADHQRIAALRDSLQAQLAAELTHLTVNGDENNRLACSLNISFAFVEGESIENDFTIDETQFVNATEERLDWYTYDLAVHRVTPNDGVYIFEQEGQLYKIQFLTYYNDEDEARFPTMLISSLNPESFPALNNPDLVSPSPCRIVSEDPDRASWDGIEEIKLLENGLNICSANCDLSLVATFEGVNVRIIQSETSGA